MAINIENPIEITLSEIPDEGRDYKYSKDSNELTESLKDLIGDHDFKVSFHLAPMGNAFQINGQYSSKMDLVCSRCGRDVEHSMNESFNEILLVEEKKAPRKSQSQHEIQSLEDHGPFCNFLPSPHLKVDEYIHELLASNEPYQLYCDRSDCETEAQWQKCK